MWLIRCLQCFLERPVGDHALEFRTADVQMFASFLFARTDGAGGRGRELTRDARAQHMPHQPILARSGGTRDDEQPTGQRGILSMVSWKKDDFIILAQSPESHTATTRERIPLMNKKTPLLWRGVLVETIVSGCRA